MARQIKEKNIEPIIETAQQWIRESLIGDNSSLSSGLLWTTENVEAVHSAFVDHPDDSTDDFFTKLRGQMSNTSPHAQHLMAEMLWALLLFPTNMSPATKREQIMDIWSMSGDSLPNKVVRLSDTILSGIGSGGVGYHNHRWRELVFLVELTGDLKHRGEDERKKLFDSYDSFVDWIDQIPTGSDRQFRHMLRYFVFPEQVERISSNQDRLTILQTFKVGTNKEIKKWTDRQVDQALAKLRVRLQSKYPKTLLDFYEEPLLGKWRLKKGSPSTQSNISFTVEDCRVFSTYPNSIRWLDVAESDQKRFKSIRDRLKQLATNVATKAPRTVDLQEGTSPLNPNARSPKDIWSCVYPALVPNKAYGLQICIVLSERGAEICLCRGAGTSQVNDAQKKIEFESALREMLDRLKTVPPQLIKSVESSLKRRWYYRRSWRDVPNVADFSTLDEWIEFARNPSGDRASVSIYLEPAELEQAGTSIAPLFEEALESFWPVIDYAYGPASRNKPRTNTRRIVFDSSRVAEAFAAIEASHFVIDKGFFSRFVSALLSKPFLILTGNSGTGKTKLAELFVRWLCRNEQDQTALVAVGADWTDNRNVVGFVNYLRTTTVKENRTVVELPVYQSTTILDLLLRAAQPENASKPHFLILDEMNLSHVERYLADFLSAIELRAGGITLHREGRPLPRTPGGPCDVPETAVLSDNVFVIGTVNVDETTYMFSPKVLDRANVIEFRVSPESPRVFLQNNHIIGPVEPSLRGCAEGFLELSSRARGLGNNALSFASYDLSASDIEQVDACHQAIDDLFAIMHKRRQEFAFRTMSEILRFLVVDYELTAETDEWKSAWAIDAQILQKILPKLHGSKRKIGSLLAALARYCEQGNRAEAVVLLSDETKAETYLTADNKREQNPKYAESYRKLCEMIEAVRRDQFVSFIQ
jgi:hypothetical protein